MLSVGIRRYLCSIFGRLFAKISRGFLFLIVQEVSQEQSAGSRSSWRWWRLALDSQRSKEGEKVADAEKIEETKLQSTPWC